MIVLDTSFLVAFFNDEDGLHEKAVSDMRTVEAEKQLVSDYVVLETATVLRYKAGLAAAKTFLEGIGKKSNLQVYNFDAADFDRITEVFVHQKHSLGFIDASVVYLANSTGSKVATYDEDILHELKGNK